MIDTNNYQRADWWQYQEELEHLQYLEECNEQRRTYHRRIRNREDQYSKKYGSKRNSTYSIRKEDVAF